MDKKFITGIVIVTLIVFIGGLFFLSKNTPVVNPHRGTLGTTQQNSSATDTNTANEKPKPPDFTLPKYDGSGNVNLVSSYNDRPTIIQFWATWCEFCRREFPVTNAIIAGYKGQINYLAIDWSEGQNSQGVTQYIKELSLDPSVLTFVIDASGSVGRSYSVTGTPVHIFIKKGGEVSLFQVGYMSSQKMKDEIAKII